MAIETIQLGIIRLRLVNSRREQRGLSFIILSRFYHRR
jgi:hypothetical protein